MTNWEKNYTSPQLQLIPRVIQFLRYNPVSGDAESLSLGEPVVRIRQRLGMTQKDLAQQLCVDPTTLYHWEHDLRRPTLEACVEYLSRQRLVEQCRSTARGRTVTSQSLVWIRRITKFLVLNPNLAAQTKGTLGDQIVTVQRGLGIWQDDLAGTVGVDPSTLAKRERGERMHGPQLLYRLMQILARSAGRPDLLISRR